MQVLVALFCGLIFGWGLLISGMLQPTKVIGFLDIFGSWDASLAVVMAAALAVTGIGFRTTAARARPLLATQTMWPTKSDVDPPLVIGAVLFGIGWGLVGLCPGPALENLATLSPRVMAFVAAMGLGMVFYSLWDRWRFGLRQSRAAITVGVDG
jgi:uncharacterized membrane protein YedE/YeeE